MESKHVYDRPMGLNKPNETFKKQIPDASQELTSKNVKEINKYIIFGVVIYLLCC